MNPTMQSRVTPEIMEALMRRRSGGLGGGGTPAMGQVMNPTPMGGPTGPSQTPFQMSPQAVPSGSIQQSSSSSASGSPSPSGGQSQQGAGTSGPADPNKALMKALLQRLIADMP